MNAAKHATRKHELTPPQISIKVSWQESSKQAMIRIENPGQLPAGFDFYTAKGVGTGLELVLSLLPPNGGKLTLIPGNGQVIALFELSAPCIYNI
jgi:two-component sensor histidine kinase